MDGGINVSNVNLNGFDVNLARPINNQTGSLQITKRGLIYLDDFLNFEYLEISP